MINVTASLIQTGLQNNEKCFYFGSPEVIQEVRTACEQVGIDTEEAVDRHQLVLVDRREEFLQNKRFDPYFLLSNHQSFISKAQKEGWSAARGAIDMSWLTDGSATPSQVLKYEAAADAVFTFQNSPVVIIVQYNYAKLAGEIVVELLKLHPLAVVGKYIKRNPYYVDSEEYFMRIVRIGRERRQQQAAS
ncbi:MAG: MEDS domain-containing protein [Chloroflexota bacterium]|nr:MEDS domain-containing protein [Chloroflexota bacterium]